MKLLFIDLETTGVDHNTQGILQICEEYHENGKVTGKIFNHTCVPKDVLISIDALNINKTKLRDIGVRTSEEVILKDFVDFVLSLPIDRADPIMLAGHNVKFDINFLNSRLKKVCDVQGLENVTSYRVVDTAVVGQFLRDAEVIELKRMSLENLAKALKLEVNTKELHDAQVDVRLTAEVYYKMIDLIKELKHGKNS